MTSRTILVQMSKFAAVGLVNTGVDFLVFTALFFGVSAHVLVANTIGYLSGTVNSFVWNKFWTFSGHAQQLPSTRQFPMFLVVGLGGLGLSNLVVWLFVSIVPVLVAKLMAVGVTFVWNFLLSRRFVYG